MIFFANRHQILMLNLNPKIPFINKVKWREQSFFWTDLGWFWPLWVVRLSLPVRAHVINSHPGRFPEIQNSEDVRWISAGDLQNYDEIAFECVRRANGVFILFLARCHPSSFLFFSILPFFLPSLHFIQLNLGILTKPYNWTGTWCTITVYTSFILGTDTLLCVSFCLLDFTHCSLSLFIYLDCIYVT